MKIADRIANIREAAAGFPDDDKALAKSLTERADQMERFLAVVEAIKRERSGLTWSGCKGPIVKHPDVDEALAALSIHGDI